jgi:hypothetical protein
MLNFDCFIYGLARNCADAVTCSLRSLDNLASCFRQTDIVAVTNDSTDGTSEILARWAAGSPSRTVFRAEGMATAVAGRTDRLATLRNLCLVEMRRRIQGGRRFDLMIVFDFDGVNSDPDLARTLCNAIATAPSNWAALFANQRQAYYDIWALRHPRWCPGDCWQEVRKSVRFLRGPLRRRAEAAAVERFVGKRQVRINPDESPISVHSAFGGLGVYRVSALDGAWYNGRDTEGHDVCEHVVFNSCVHRRGLKLYIIPGLLNDAPPEHLARGAGRENRPWDYTMPRAKHNALPHAR